MNGEGNCHITAKNTLPQAIARAGIYGENLFHITSYD